MSMRWLLSALAAVAAMDPSANPNCYLVPILVIAPHTPLPAMNCATKPFPAGDCMKEVVRATLTTVDSIKTHGTEWNCLGDADHLEYASSVHYRGDSTLRLIKHQMAIKLDTPQSFLGLPADTPWSLHGPYFDASLLRNHVAHHIFRQTGRYSPRTQHIALYIKNAAGVPEYKGFYLLLETVSYGPNRVGLAENSPNCSASERANGGWAWLFDPLSYGAYSPNIVKNMYTNQFGGGRPLLTYPAGETTSQAMRDAFVSPNGFLPQYHKYLWEGMLTPDRLEEHIDIGSFVDYMLHTEWSLNQDAYSRSMYYFKDRDHPIEAGPVWDFNLAFGAGAKAHAQNWLFQTHEAWKRLTCNYKFTSLLIARWKALRAGVWADGKIEAFVTNARAPFDKMLTKCPNNQWMSSQPSCAHVALSTRGSYADQVNAMVASTLSRARWMDAQIEKLYQPLNARVCMGVGRIPKFNCGPDGNDPGCLSNPKPYYENVKFPAIRGVNHAKCDGEAPNAAPHVPSVDPCWVAVGSYRGMWWLTPTCSGFGWCAQGPGAKCQCTAGRKTFDCSPNPPAHLIAITASSEDAAAMSNPLVWAGAAAALSAVAVILVIKRKRNPGYETL
ncbi:hypothetical protein SDRG_09610 [Saprolegnia diclina VS20]|uniref:EGF-like domain-containing protein n=1 Tax=Saprolegnia diclina (strain VS20) TaxID=1156394 RepID=T0RK21_SAPDV|nr:hypothetical protein SDRG_09610 [Saprolegnia diclina VS20]EQC32633.1 hypothetical protein SDRG_09610 [Saprolegnia diclina VS20]|eukprot:XP_008613777.1 hypothetical protein SDRG_09610 [Saprolegnia diclina VS20]